MKYVWVLMTVLSVMVAGATSVQASTICFATKAEAAYVAPQSKVFYSTIKKNRNDHTDYFNAGSVGSKCWHTHHKLPTMNHLPRHSDSGLVLEYLNHFWQVPTYVPRK